MGFSSLPSISFSWVISKFGPEGIIQESAIVIVGGRTRLIYCEVFFHFTQVVA
uniref:Uncharacterized protein n=1 Tax=Anguilla anguilla TaxID=7936 RepID=A0A0E9P800_ANGAN